VTDREENEPSRSWWDLLRGARTRLRELTGGSILDGTLARFLLPGEELPPIDVDKVLSGFTPTATNTAILGFLIASGAVTGSDTEGKFFEGVDRCVRQQAPASGPSVHTDPKLLLGLSAGLAFLKDSSGRKVWLEKQLASLKTQHDLLKSVMSAHCLTLLGNAEGWRTLEEALRRAELKHPADAPTVLWALHLEPTRFSDAVRSELDRLRRNALEMFPLGELEGLDVFGYAFTANVASHLLWASVWDLERTALGRLISILRQFPTAMALEPASPDDERDVQRIPWTMLAGIYPDLRDEQWLAQFGVYQPRSDLAIESLKAVVEAKYIKRASDFRKIQDELVADATTYTQKPERIDKVVALIYDATSSQHKYEQMRTDLKKVPSIAEVLIIAKVSPRYAVRGRKVNPVRANAPLEGDRPPTGLKMG